MRNIQLLLLAIAVLLSTSVIFAQEASRSSSINRAPNRNVFNELRPENQAPEKANTKKLVSHRAQPEDGEAMSPEIVPETLPRPRVAPARESVDSAPLQVDEEYSDMDGEFFSDEYNEYDGPGYMGWRPQLISGFYVRAEYLSWATDGMRLPPLVTTAPVGTPRAGAGALGRATTTTLFGGDEVNGEMRSGGRITMGLWFDPDRSFGLEGDYLALGDERTNFTGTSTGNPILARPFFNMITGQESAELVAFPNVISGTVDVQTLTQLQGAGGRLRYAICCSSDCGPAWCDPCRSVLHGYRMNLLAGYRYLQLNDGVSINENLTSTDPLNPGRFVINDSFNTQNQFNGVDLGVLLECRRGRWTLDLLSKIALGNNHSRVNINGGTAITDNGVTTNFTGGLLAQRTNIGNYSNDRFAVVPELGMTLGYNLSPNLRVIVGYTFMYWSQVARAGDQISLDVNPNLIPPETVPFTGPLRPQFAYHFTDFWAQGVNVGIEGRF